MKKTRLIKKLPAIRYDNKWIIYSPYSQKIFVVKDPEDVEIENILIAEKMLGEPKNSIGDPETKNIVFITTTACNLRCKYCYEAQNEENDCRILETKTALNIIKDYTQGNVKKLKIIFFGGEPTLNMELIKECVNYCKKLKIKTNFQISTNGVIPREKLDYLIDNNFTIQISTDGIPKIQNEQRPKKGKNKNTAKDVASTISYLVKNNFPFKIRMTISNISLKYLGRSINYFGKMGVKYIHIEGVSDSDGYNKNKDTQLDYRKFAESLMRALKIAKRYNIRIINSAFMNISNPSTKFCGGLCGNQIVVNPDGNISVCYEVQDYQHPYSDNLMIGRYENDKMKLDKEKLEQIKEYSVENYKKCSDCFAKFICSGGCPIRSGVLKKANNNYCEQVHHILYNVIKELYKKS